MKGAIAEPSVSTIKAPKRTKKMIIGVNHHFLLCFIKSQNSTDIESFDIILLILRIVFHNFLFQIFAWDNSSNMYCLFYPILTQEIVSQINVLSNLLV